MKRQLGLLSVSILAILSLLCATAFADWDPGDPYLWAQTPQIDNGWDVCLLHKVLADDFYWSYDYVNTQTKITDIHFWISWYNDVVPINMDNVHFSVQIYEANGSWSSNLRIPAIAKPKTLIWTYDGIGNRKIRYYGNGNQNWHCPATPDWEYNNHNQVWQVNITDIWNAPVTGPVSTPITQSPPNMLIPGRHYWLVIHADPIPVNPGGSQPVVGWKTSVPTLPTQCALWGDILSPELSLWYPIDLTPNDGQLNEITFTDFAFVLTNDPVNLNTDFGDAPVSIEDYPGHWISTTYKTKMTDGARHTIVPGVKLGSQIDGEGDGQPTVNADGDDNNNLDDEDGVSFITPLVPGTMAAVEVIASCDGWVYGWMDFNRDGDWTDSLENIFMRPVTAGRNVISFPIPETAVINKFTYARFRFTSIFPGPGTVLDYYGPAGDGEVEDYKVMLVAESTIIPNVDMGDAPDSTNSFMQEMLTYDSPFIINDGIRANFPTVYLIGSPPYGPKHRNPNQLAYLGAAVTKEYEADQYPDDDDPNNNINPPTAKDNMDNADDGVDTSTIVLPRCGAANFDVTVTIIDPNQTYYLNVWIDFNQDGDWNDTHTNGEITVPEWAVQNQVVKLDTAGVHTVTTNSFTSAQLGNTWVSQVWMRVTLAAGKWEGPESGYMGWQDSVAGAGPEGGYYGGETEDYYFTPDHTSAGCPDLNLNGTVELSDLSILSSNWGRTLTVSTCFMGDINNNYTVEIGDLMVMATYWMTASN